MVMTDKEEALIEIAVWLDYAIRYWECALANGVHIDDAWYEQCIGNEMCQQEFDKHGHDSPGMPYPRIHTIIELISEEWQCKANGQTDKERELDFSNFSRLHCLERLNTLKVQHPNLKSKIMMNCVEWWKPRTLDFNDEEVDELSGDNPPPMPDGPSTAEEDKPIDEDDSGEKMPQMSCTLDAPPARRPQTTNAKWAWKIGTESIKAESAPITSKSARKRTAVVMLEDIVPSLERVEWTILVDGTEFHDRLLNIENHRVQDHLEAALQLPTHNLHRGRGMQRLPPHKF
ncbi:hypothetical protein EI94DRAFT_1699748 [Lactarius quietus]|nr:hypothetical protein EI94DRAFT_1699748 [Lactarius quietus]